MNNLHLLPAPGPGKESSTQAACQQLQEFRSSVGWGFASFSGQFCLVSDDLRCTFLSYYALIVPRI